MLFSYTLLFAMLTTFVAAAPTFSSISPRSGSADRGKLLVDAVDYLTGNIRNDADESSWTRSASSRPSVS